MRRSHWRKVAAPIIRETIAEVGTEDRRKLRRYLRARFPFGERKRWPYKVWCHEISCQLGLKRKPIDGWTRWRRKKQSRQPTSPLPGQRVLFE